MALGLEIFVLMLPGIIIAGLVFIWIKTSADADRDRR
jgi:hypothetical protein